MRIIESPLKSVDAKVLYVLILVSIVASLTTGEEYRKVNIIVGVLAAICLLLLVIDARTYEININNIIRYPRSWCRGKVQMRPWTEVHSITLLYDGTAEAGSIVFHFLEEQAWEIAIHSATQRVCIVDYARKRGVDIKQHFN